MKIWWCEQHYANGTESMCLRTVWRKEIGEVVIAPCLMVRMELSPVVDDPPEITEPLFINTHGTW